MGRASDETIRLRADIYTLLLFCGPLQAKHIAADLNVQYHSVYAQLNALARPAPGSPCVERIDLGHGQVAWRAIGMRVDWVIDQLEEQLAGSEPKGDTDAS